MSQPFPSDLAQRISTTGVIAVLMIDDANDAVPVAQALLEGGVDCMELTLRTPAAMDALRNISAEVPAMTAGVGTILTPAQAREVKIAGASFGVSPGVNPRVVSEAVSLGLPFAPGVCTPSDIEVALEHGCTLLKFFPCEPSGGLAYLKSIAAPYAHLGVKFVPLGGIDASNAARYIREPLVHAIGGSWLAPRDVIARKDWSTITANAREAVQIIAEARGGQS